MRLKIIQKFKKVIWTLFILVIVGLLGLGFFATRYPVAYRAAIVKYSNENDIDPYLVASIINVESSYDKLAVSSKGAKGLMQISPQTGQWGSEVLEMENYNESDLFDPDINIKIGSWYINRLLKEFNGDLDLTLAAYNAGSGNVRKWLADEKYCNDGISLDKIPFKETEDYLVRVKKNYKIYSKIYKEHLLNIEEEDSSYINLFNNLRKTLKEILKMF